MSYEAAFSFSASAIYHAQKAMDATNPEVAIEEQKIAFNFAQKAVKEAYKRKNDTEIYSWRYAMKAADEAGDFVASAFLHVTNKIIK